VARLGDGWFTVAHTAEEFADRRRKIDACAADCGRAGKTIPSALFATFYLSSDGARAEEKGWSLAERYFRQPRAKLNHLSAFFGTPEQCAQKLHPYIGAGLTSIVARLIAPDAQAQMRLFMNDLRPRLAPRSGRSEGMRE
jgi:alkanesulfonate monooxygenase SsuD/methylene tetrahydromethanopterin reductase-like flavin-dependent oxidoreductase (luciferase family)